MIRVNEDAMEWTASAESDGEWFRSPEYADVIDEA
jgi:hypothetical protein